MKERRFNLFDFHELLALPQLYQPEDYYYPPFWEFSSRFKSLQRFYHVNLILARQFVKESELSERTFDPAAEVPTESELLKWADEMGVELGSDVGKDIHFDMTWEDKSYYVNFLYTAVITQLFTLFETLCIDCITMLKEDLLIDEEPPSDGGRIVERCLEWISKHTQCRVEIKDDTWLTFNLMRQIRNNLVHGKTRPISQPLTERHEVVRQDALGKGLEESEGYVRKSFEVIADAAKVIELVVVGKLHQQKE
jgi:hypothetical protein